MIQLYDGSPLMRCGIADISDGGARLSVQQARRLPHAFLLWLAGGGRVRRRCVVAWRSDSEIGVRFDT